MFLVLNPVLISIKLHGVMRESNNPSQTPVIPAARRRYLYFLVILGIFALFFGLGGQSLDNKDSVRFAEISREILEHNDWILLRFGGAIYPDKPALHFWMVAGLYKIFGISPLIARLPEAVAGFCGVLIAFFFAAKILKSSEAAFLAALILLSTYGYYFWARRTRIDIELAVFYSLSMVLFYNGTESGVRLRKTMYYAGFWLATGFAFMCKGPVAFTNLAVVIVYGIYAVRKVEGCKIAPGLLAMTSPLVALPILPWVLPLLNHPRFSGFVQAYNETVIMHRGFSLFTYFYDFPMRLFPASPFFFLGLWGFFRYRKVLNAHRGLVFILLWVGVYVFILHLSSGKNARYLLPIHMPVSIAAAWGILFYTHKYPAAFGRIMRWGDRIFLVGAAAGLFLPLGFAYYHKAPMLAALPYIVVLALALIVARKLLPLKVAGLFLSFILILLSIEIADNVVDKKTAVYLQISDILKKEGLAPEEITFYRCDTGNRASHALSFYYNRLIPCSTDFKKIAGDPNIRGIVSTDEALGELKPPPQIDGQYREIPVGNEFVIILKPPQG